MRGGYLATDTFVRLDGIGPKIVAQLQLNKISQKELSRRLGVAHKTVWTWITGKHTPTRYYVEQMASVFGCSVEYLLGEFD